MIKPVLAVDIDDVLYPFSSEFLKYANNRLGANKTMEDMTTYRLDTVYGVSYSKIVELIEAFMAEEFINDFEPILGSQEALLQLKESFDLHIVTARLSKYTTQTQYWIDRFFPNIFSRIHYYEFYALTPRSDYKKMTKLMKCREINAFALIDDNAYNIENVMSGGLAGILFGEYAWHDELSDKYQPFKLRSWEHLLGRPILPMIFHTIES
jgi:5'(3')-deoxyribonucleotidase